MEWPSDLNTIARNQEKTRIQIQTIEKLIRQMPRICEAVIKATSRKTKNLLAVIPLLLGKVYIFNMLICSGVLKPMD